ncbi:GNAT family N-acetyltransferase [Pseudalkalibacillus hwajinpoensis]|uniref:GNAT family N-acetyltransferase n=1 Tax=Guptibacillus hwajinpoensis TaxID=208199 RepID=UPI001CFD1221|nr:GNAT family N-acetyltransferase [Pseudalkalibacillus hwajinpoensis]
MSFSLEDRELKAGVKLLDGRPFYLSLEGIEKLKEVDRVDSLLDRLDQALASNEVHHVSITLDRFHTSGIQRLKNNSYFLRSTTLEYYKDFQLEKVCANHNCSITYEQIEEARINSFLTMWELCSRGSLNSPSKHTIGVQYDAMKKEIGEQYKTSCYLVYWEGKQLGIVIPIIEPGTKEEGRLFYMGILPEQRGKGFGTPLHQLGLALLQEKGATHYIGSTGVENIPMQQIFRNNNCKPFFQAVTYIKEK